MKIKCPFWNDCFFEDESDKFFIHLAEHHYGEIKHELWRIIFKIHEKIEVYKNEHRGTISYAKLLAMKSLLEDEK